MKKKVRVEIQLNEAETNQQETNQLITHTMKQWNPKANLSIEIEANDLSGSNGHTVWHVVNGIRKRTMSRRADGKDFDWMTNKQMTDFEKGKYQFKISAADAAEYFQYYA